MILPEIPSRVLITDPKTGMMDINWQKWFRDLQSQTNANTAAIEILEGFH